MQVGDILIPSVKKVSRAFLFLTIFKTTQNGRCEKDAQGDAKETMYLPVSGINSPVHSALVHCMN